MSALEHSLVAAARFGLGVELNPGYFMAGALHCAAAEDKIAIPSLFDLMDAERPLQAAE